MQARGIDSKMAQRIMVRARLDSIIRLIKEKNLEEDIASYLDQVL